MTIYFYAILTSIFTYYIIYYYRNKIGVLLGVMDKPDEKRKIHKFPTPKTASYSIVLTLFVFLLINNFFDIIDSNYNNIIVGSLLIFFVGFFDDKYKLSPSIKIILVSAIILLLCLSTEDLIIKKFYIYAFDTFFYLEKFSLIFSILCVLCLINSLNLADGINGLATGIIFFWLIYISHMYGANDNLLIKILLLNLILILIHNYKGDHFLGDSGSLMLSSFVALLIIKLNNQSIDDPSHQRSAESILILFLIPGLDMIRLFIERLIKKKNPTKGDKNHFHHYLINQFSLTKTLLIYLSLVILPILISLYTDVNKILLILGIVLIYFLFIFKYKNTKKNNE